MLQFGSKQIEGLRDTALSRTADGFTESLRQDFRDTLGAEDYAPVRDRVRTLLTRYYNLGFKERPHLYRLVAWGLFLGPDYLEMEQDGALMAIARSDEPEADRFRMIRAKLTEKGRAEAQARIKSVARNYTPGRQA